MDIFIFLTDVLSETISLDQSASIDVKPSVTLKLICKVSVPVMSDSWVWFRQKTGSGLEYVGHIQTSGSTYYASYLQGRVTINREILDTLYIQMLSVTSADSGIYYCARYSQSDKEIQDLS
uniref:Ig-like domain-containing protein n=1 Tax=Leptobrachium leishanense TaxID=445787 RepID=A0A8C5PAB2_9ANUR